MNQKEEFRFIREWYIEIKEEEKIKKEFIERMKEKGIETMGLEKIKEYEDVNVMILEMI